MEYVLEVPKICGETVSLVVVADAMAKARATAYGSTSFHKPTYDNVLRSIGDSLMREIRYGNLKICDTNGFAQPVGDAIEQGERDGAFNAVMTYVEEPNWAQLEAQHPDREMATGCWHWGGIDIGGKTEPDILMSQLIFFQTSLHYLNEWGSKAGNRFTITEKPT